MFANLPPVMPFVILILLFLPVKLDRRGLIRLAFFLWMTGGLVLTVFGILRMMQAAGSLDVPTTTLAIVAALAVGLGKGRFVLSKTSVRNLERINALTMPQKPINVYGLRSWIIIGVMVGLSVALNVLEAPVLWRGVVNLAVGFALIISSFAYLQAVEPVEAPQA